MTEFVECFSKITYFCVRNVYVTFALFGITSTFFGEWKFFSFMNFVIYGFVG